MAPNDLPRSAKLSDGSAILPGYRSLLAILRNSFAGSAVTLARI